MNIFIYVSTYICMCMYKLYMYIYARMYVYVYVCLVYRYVRICVFTYVCKHAWIYVHSVYVRMFMYACICFMYIYFYIPMYVHTVLLQTPGSVLAKCFQGCTSLWLFRYGEIGNEISSSIKWDIYWLSEHLLVSELRICPMELNSQSVGQSGLGFNHIIT
jgi:hypothetical protein